MSNAQKINEQADHDNFERICTEMKTVRSNYALRKTDKTGEFKTSINKNMYKPREIPEEFLARPLDMFLGVKPEIR